MLRTIHAMLLVCVTAVAACVSYEEPLATNAPFDESLAYVYGRFQRAPRGLDLREVSLVVTGPDDGKVNIAFETEQSVYAVALAPGAYRVTHVALAKGAAIRVPGDYSEEEISPIAFDAAAGEAVYIGDWMGGVDVADSGAFVSASGRYAGPIRRYEETTREFRDANPQFARATFRSALQTGP